MDGHQSRSRPKRLKFPVEARISSFGIEPQKVINADLVLSFSVQLLLAHDVQILLLSNDGESFDKLIPNLVGVPVKVVGLCWWRSSDHVNR